MKRRNFVQGLLAVPAVTTVVDAQQAPPPASTPQQQPQPKPNTPARQEGWRGGNAPNLQLTGADLTADPAPHFFTAVQLATLQKLGEVLVPPLKNNPGAVEAKAPEFIDFLISVSPADRQKSYQFGLDQLELQSKGRFGRSFHELHDEQVDQIMKPLMVVRPWPEDLPKDQLQAFVAIAHEDLRRATMNSREWAEASAKSGRLFSRGSRNSGYYWNPIDPIV